MDSLKLNSYTNTCRKEERELENKHKKETIVASIGYRRELLALYSEQEPNLQRIEEKRKEQSIRYDALMKKQEKEMHEMIYACVSRHL